MILNILVLSPFKGLKPDKTEYSPEAVQALEKSGNTVSVKKCFSLLLEAELKKAVKSDNRPDLIIVPDYISGEEDFRSKFAFIIDRAQHKAQEVPNAKEKIDIKKSLGDLKDNIKYIISKIKKEDVTKKEREARYVSYKRKKTHIFPLELENKTAYAFTYRDSKAVVTPDGVSPEALGEIPGLVNAVFDENSEKYPGGYSLTDRTLKVTTFTERHFPGKGDSKNEVIRKSAMLAAACVFLVAGFMFIYNMYVMPAQQEALQSDIRTIFYEGNTDSSAAKNAKKPIKLNWKIRKKNSDIKGWVHIDHTKIDYPVLQCKSDNKYSQFYLNHNYLKQYTPRGFGAIFIDYRSKKGMASRNIILHGHHMEDGSMFGNLMNYGKYTGNLGFYKKAPVVKLSTPKGGTKTYKIISVFKSNVNPAQGEYFDFYCAKFKSQAQFMNYVYNLRIRSLINCPVNVNEHDQLVTLVTCSYEFPGFRTVVVARKCRKNESVKVDVGSASLNKNPVWPQCYYGRFRATRPSILTFKKAYKKGLIKWYDGSAKLKGSEQLPTSLKETTQPTTSAQQATQPKPTKPPKKYYKIKITKFNKHGKKISSKKKVVEGTKVKLPKVRNYKKFGYKYTFKKWKVKGIPGKKYISRKAKTITVRFNIRLKAKYKKTKIYVKPKPAPAKPTKPTKPTKPAEKPRPATEKPTEAENPEDVEE